MAAGLVSNERVRYANTRLSGSRKEVLIVERIVKGFLVCMRKEEVFEKIKEQHHQRLSFCIEKTSKNNTWCSGSTVGEEVAKSCLTKPFSGRGGAFGQVRIAFSGTTAVARVR
jgi:hypothetical protein